MLCLRYKSIISPGKFTLSRFYFLQMLFNFICKTVLPHARPFIKLEQTYHGLLSSSLSSQFTTTPSNSSNQNSFTVRYLINSCGVLPESAVKVSKTLNLSKSPNTADSVLSVLKNQGFTKSEISKVVLRHPRVLLSDPENTLLPNFKILNSIGLSSTDRVSIVIARPQVILQKRFQDKALLCVDYLKSVLGSDDKVINAIKRYPLALTYDLDVYATENIRMLLDIGISKEKIEAMLAQQPRTFFTSADRFKKVIDDVMEMGFDPSKSRFLWAIHAVRSMSKSTWEKKVELYKSFGWSEDEILSAFEKYPGCMMASMDKISRILDFVMNTMGWEISYIVQWPIVICFSFEKRVIPRCLAYQYLAEKGLTEEIDDFNFTKWLMYSEKKFLTWVVKRYEEEGPELLKLYQKHLSEANGSTPTTRRKRAVI